jgi:hypothetical protein
MFHRRGAKLAVAAGAASLGWLFHSMHQAHLLAVACFPGRMIFFNLALLASFSV